MVYNKLFYKYRSLKEGNNSSTIINLANNQLYFDYPSNFNDPFDSRIYCFYEGTKEEIYEKTGINIDEINKEMYEEHNGIIKIDYRKLFIEDGKKNLHGDVLYVLYPKICCFSEVCDDILMWSHYADYHKGICLCFKSVKVNNEYCLPIGTPNSQFANIYFQRVGYHKNVPEPINLFDEDMKIKMHEVLLDKLLFWNYEQEFRIILDPDSDKRLLSEEMFEKGIIKYQKESLQGIIFGMKIKYENAELVYNTVKENYLDKGYVVKFYEAKEVRYKYEVKVDEIKNINTYLLELKHSDELHSLTLRDYIY
ncbi:DUF2971 domain-containing protein [Methanosarcina vacuolata]|uniref:DUF2971 domain-containing protein n=1 Tax=Methanosarcina vacuolata Z-761 TaxID=1434123 RepID=A0A0E3Q236_9EURY|nr:DUF2971 domain-containing protein [Methanosarcina vacuolata]AKB43333.1 hypothetical protein MSVAZ_1064 [Methanosarcina vacuolata Z-761]